MIPPAFFLLFWAAAFCVGGIGTGSLASWDEAYYAIVSREIFRSGDWVHLTFFDTPFYDKPPLYFWATSLFYRVFGVNEFATRLTSGLAGAGVVLAVYALGKRLLDRRAALAGAGILLSSSDFLHYARWGTLDITHLFFFTLAMVFYLDAAGRPSAWIGFWLASAGAVMTKGPIGLAIPALAIAGSLAAKKTVPASAGTFPTHGGLFVGLLVGVILIVGGLTFFPSLALGPIVEHLAGAAGQTFAAAGG